MTDQRQHATRKRLPVWLTRLVMVVFAPLLILLALLFAAMAAWHEFRDELRFLWMDAKQWWREGR